MLVTMTNLWADEQNRTDLFVLTMSFSITFCCGISTNRLKFHLLLRSMCAGSVKDDGEKNGSRKKNDLGSTVDWRPVGDSYEISDCVQQIDSREDLSSRRRFFKDVRFEVDRVIEVLQKDGPGFDTQLALNNLRLRVSHCLVREVLMRILKSINHSNKDRCAWLGYNFFAWSSQQDEYRHTTSMYNLLMKIYADCKEFKEMWRLLDELTEKGYSTTPRTFIILICTCGEEGMARKVVERFLKSKTFNFRPFKHSFNAILHSLFVIDQYRLVEWVYTQMIYEKYSPDILTYNLLLFTKHKLQKNDQFERLLDEFISNGLYPDLHTYNILLHRLGRENKPHDAIILLNHMKEVGCEPRVIHFTSLIDGLSRAGNLEACRYFFDETVKEGCMPDVVCYTVMITAYVVAEELEMAQAMFDEMIIRGQVPNVITYNAMIRGLCVAQKFKEAQIMLREMESKGCKPNFVVYRTLVGNLRKARKFSEANKLIREMADKGRYVHLLYKLRRYGMFSKREDNFGFCVRVLIGTYPESYPDLGQLFICRNKPPSK